ncbi:RNA polymerase sigma factor [Streptosporangium canum]|uniref:RNA polymerase sigma factor n=1 Tax=Streptosporangium canum TaxID=324952 RepID=UPI0036AE4F85
MAVRHRHQPHSQAPQNRGPHAARRGQARPPADAPSHEERVAAQVSAESLRPALAEAIARLGRGERDVLLLTALAGLSHEEIAAALGISYGTVGSRLSRARAKIRAALGGTNPMEANHG